VNPFIFFIVEMFLSSILFSYIIFLVKEAGLKPPVRSFMYRFYDTEYYLYRHSRLKKFKWLYKWLIMMSITDKLIIIQGIILFLYLIGSFIIEIMAHIFSRDYKIMQNSYDNSVFDIFLYINIFAILSSLITLYIYYFFNKKGFKPIVPFMLVRYKKFIKQMLRITKLKKYKSLRKWVILLIILDIFIILGFLSIVLYIIYKIISLS